MLGDGISEGEIYRPRPIVTPTGGNVLEISGTISSQAFAAAVNAAPAGPLTIRPTGGVGTFTVNNNGDWIPTRQDLTIQKGIFRDIGTYPVGGRAVGASANGFTFEDCTIHCYYIDGCSNWTFRRCQMPFNHVSYGADYGVPAGSGAGGNVQYNATNWLLEDCDISGYIVDAAPSQHCEGINIGTGNNGGLINRCTFDDGGNTGAIFFTWWYDNTRARYPRNICITNCTFTNTINPWWHIDVQDDLYLTYGELGLNLHANPYTCTWDGNKLLVHAQAWAAACS